MYRVHQSQLLTPQETQRSITYDAAGNREATELYDGSGTLLSRLDFTYSWGNQLIDRTESGTTTGFTFDSTGALTIDQDADLEFARYPSGEVADIYEHSTGNLLTTFTRDAHGRPVGLEDSLGLTRDLLWGNPGGDWPLAGIDHNGDEVLWLAAEGLLFGKLFNGTNTPMAADGTGTLLLAGTEWLDDPGAFGEDAAPATSVTTRFAYASMELLDDAPTYQLAQRRLYNPETGRFAAPDPLGLAAGPNRYVYAYNDPVRFSDPTGLMPGWGNPTFGMTTNDRDQRAVMGAVSGALSGLTDALLRRLYGGPDVWHWFPCQLPTDGN